MSNNVLEFKTVIFQVRAKTTDQKLCAHSAVVVDEQNQMIECGQCGVLMSPFEYVVKVAKNEIRWSNQVKYLKIEASQIEDQITELKRQRTNIKAQLRRLNH